MTVVRSLGVVARLLLFVVVTWLAVAFAAPTVDPLLVNVAWLALVVAVVFVPPSRRLLARWVTTGRLRAAPATVNRRGAGPGVSPRR